MFKRDILNNGVRVVTEKIPYVRSVSIGIWVGTGSRNENTANNGISHFIEHMLFKGTDRRSARDIAECIDAIGGQINAFTGKECTCYYTKTLDTHIDIAIDILADMLFNSKISKADMDIEKKVILEEIDMYEDSPEELVHDILSETVWKGDTLGYPILGTGKSLKKITRESIRKYMSGNYSPANCVISVAGNFEIQAMMNLLEKYFGSWSFNGAAKTDYGKSQFVPGISVKEKDIEQVHVCIGFKGIEQGKDSLYTLLAINNVLGGGMSSRLFQKIREEKGLAYSIYSYPSSYKDAGLFTIYAGMNPEYVSKVIEMSMDEVGLLIKDRLSQEELSKSKEQLKGSFILGLESTSSRMNSIGRSELLLGRIYSSREVLEKIDAITMKNVEEVIAQVFTAGNISLSAVGNIRKDYQFKDLLFI